MLLSILKALYSFEAIVKVKPKYCGFETCWCVRKAAVDNRDLPGPSEGVSKVKLHKILLSGTRCSKPLGVVGWQVTKVFLSTTKPRVPRSTLVSLPSLLKLFLPAYSLFPAGAGRTLPPRPAAGEAHCICGSAPGPPPADVFGALCKFPVMPSILRKMGR